MDNIPTSEFDCEQDMSTKQNDSARLPEPPRPRTPPKKKWERRLPRQYIVASSPGANSLDIDVEIETTDTGIKRAVKALVDCGATGQFMDKEWARANKISTRSLPHPIPVFNVDGTPNKAGKIDKITDMVLCYDSHTERIQFAIMQLGKQSMILSFTWLYKHNPKINWQTKEVRMS